MKRWYSSRALTTVLTTGLVLTASGYAHADGRHESRGAYAPASGPVTIAMAVSGSNQELAIRQEEANAFTKVHPDIKITFVNLGPNRLQKTLTLIAGGNPPDIFYINDWTKPLAMKGALMPLDTFIKNDRSFHLNQYYPNLVHALVSNGKLYGLPQEVSPVAIYYNADLFRKAGLALPTDNWTQATFMADAKKLSDASKKRYGFYMSDWYAFWGGFVARNGGTVYRDNGTRSGFNSAGALTGLTVMRQMVVDDHSSPSPAAEQALGQGDDALFRNQQVAMIDEGMWYLPEFKQQPLSFKWDVVRVPKAQNQITEAGILNWSISAQTQHAQQAWEVLKFFTGPQGAKIVAKYQFALPAITNETALDIVRASHYPPNVQAFITSAPLVTTQEQDSPKSNEVDTAIQTQVDLMLEGRQSAKSTQTQIVDAMNKILGQ